MEALNNIMNKLSKLSLIAKIAVLIAVVIFVQLFIPQAGGIAFFVVLFLCYVFFVRPIYTISGQNQNQELTNYGMQLLSNMLENTTEENVQTYMNYIVNVKINNDPNTVNWMKMARGIVNLSDLVTTQTKENFSRLLQAKGVLPDSAGAIDSYDVEAHAKRNLGMDDQADPDLTKLAKTVASQPTEEGVRRLIEYLNSVKLSNDSETSVCMKYTYGRIYAADSIPSQTKEDFEKTLKNQGIEIYSGGKYDFSAQTVEKVNAKVEQKQINKKLLQQEIDRLKSGHFQIPANNNFAASYQTTNLHNQANDDFMQQEMMRQHNEFAMEEARKSVTPFDMGGYVQGDGFNPSDTMAADAMRQAEQMNQMNDMNNMGGMGMF